MSGIFGVFNRNGEPVEEKTVNTMLEAMSYWEPDEHGTWIDGPVALGHTMLWNTPESKYEHFPVEQDAYVLTMDARIDNRDELLKELELPVHPLEEIGDSEFILAAYRKWGEDCPKYLLGDFAFAIWDGRKKQLFCARDPFGIKLFHYYVDEEVFIFSNDILGLLSNSLVLKAYDEKILSSFLRDKGVHTHRDTFFYNIKKISGGTSLIITINDVHETTYWCIKNSPVIRYDTYQEYVDTLRILLESAVDVRLRTVYPIVSHMSGGIDSSSISVLAARKLKEKNKLLHAYNWINIPENGEEYETEAYEFSRRIAKIEQIEHHEFMIGPEDIAEWFDEHNILTKGVMFYFREYYVQNETMKLGARTILSGWGGDEFISYGAYRYIQGLFKQRKFTDAFKALYKEKEQKRYSWYQFIKRCIYEMDIPLFRDYINWKNKKPIDLYEINDYMYIKKEFVETMKKYSFEELPNLIGVHNQQKMLFQYGHIQNRIDSWSLSSFANRLEYSYPLLDRRIVEFAFKIPEEIFYAQKGNSRYLFRSAVSHLLPFDIAMSAKNNEIKINNTYKKYYETALEIWYKKHKNDDMSKYDNSYIDYKNVIYNLEEFDFYHSDPYTLGKIVNAILVFNSMKK